MCFVVALEILEVESVPFVSHARMWARHGLLRVKCSQIYVRMQATSRVHPAHDHYRLGNSKSLRLHSALLVTQMSIQNLFYCVAAHVCRGVSRTPWNLRLAKHIRILS